MADAPVIPNYKETTVAGSSWVRAHDVHIKNPHGGTPYMVISEEKIMLLADGDKITKPSSNLVVSFDVNNPKHLQLYGLINDIYIEERDKRDTQPQIIPLVDPV